VVRVREPASTRSGQIPEVLRSPQACCVGIDVAQVALDIAERPSAVTWQVANDDTGITTLVSRLSAELLGSHSCRIN
jgi:hypothetical protein